MYVLEPGAKIHQPIGADIEFDNDELFFRHCDSNGIVGGGQQVSGKISITY